MIPEWRYNAMYTQDTEYKIIFEIKEQNIEFDNLDIDFYIKKNCKLEPDKAYLKIWNLDTGLYKMLLNSSSIINLYIKTNSGERIKFFSGCIESETVKRINISAGLYKNIPDMCTCLRLIDSAQAYTKAYINRDYREEVSSERIILDCVEAMGLAFLNTGGYFPRKTYETFKAKGKPHNILRTVCEDIGIKLFIQNDIVRVSSGLDFSNIGWLTEFNYNNCSVPQEQGLSEITFYTKSLSECNPGDIVKCSFDELSGLYVLTETAFSGNNYDKKCVTKITIEV